MATIFTEVLLFFIYWIHVCFGCVWVALFTFGIVWQIIGDLPLYHLSLQQSFAVLQKVSFLFRLSVISI